MPKESESQRVKDWHRRLNASQKTYDEWSKRYRVEMGEQYFQGQQWQQQGMSASEPYVINLFYSAIKTKLPSLLYYRPHFLVRPKPQRSDDPLSAVEGRAKLREDVLNQWVENEEFHFNSQTRLALHEAMFKFGIIEVGYTADFLDNPNAGRPMLDENGQEERDGDGRAVIQPAQTLDTERIYLKRIPAAQFRFPSNSHNEIEHNDWLGYYEWHYPSDIRASPNYKNTRDLRGSGRLKGDLSEPDPASPDDRYRSMIKLWRIWDLREHKRLVFTDTGEKFLLEEPFKTIPFAILRFDPILDSAYPLPLVYNWISPQDEMNETREMQRSHRKRFLRKYTAITSRITPEELHKLEENRDGVFAWASAEGAVIPVTDAPLDAAVARNIPQTKDDFNEISGITSEQRGIAEADTATQSNILDIRSRVKESLQRVQVGEWLSQIGKLILLTLEEKAALPFWVKTVVDPASPGAFLGATQVAEIHRLITSLDLGKLDFDVMVNVEALSPVTEMMERQEWIQVLALLKDPQLLMVLSANEPLLRKTLGYFGIRSERDIQQIKQMGALMLQLQLSTMQQSGSSAPPGQASAAASPTPPADIQSQVTSQAGLPNVQ